MKILVTGTTGGVGGAVARAAREAGHEVVAFDRADFEALSRTSSFAAYPHDLSGLDALVFATGCCPVAPLLRTDDTLFAETIKVNCGYFLSLVRSLVAERLYSPKGMRIVAVSSVSAVEGWAGGGAYCASKGALSALCRALAVELKPRRISITVLEPRYIATRMFRQGAGRMGAGLDEAVSPEAFAALVLRALDDPAAAETAPGGGTTGQDVV